jgi:hypothetical protein
VTGLSGSFARDKVCGRLIEPPACSV